MRQTRERRRRHEARGRFGEAVAAWRLRIAGYRIVAAREKTPFGEIDLVAVKRGLVAFVEVKARPDLRACIEAVGGRQRQRIERAAAWLIGQRPALRQQQTRFDIVGVIPYRLPIHVKDAWRPGRGM